MGIKDCAEHIYKSPISNPQSLPKNIMTFIDVFKALGPIDARNIRRDSLLRWMAFIPFLFVLMFRYLMPWMRDELMAQFNFDLAPYYILLLSYGFVIGIPVIFGVVIGFLLLDERDDGTLTALQVTPLSLNNYLMYRVAMPMLISVVLVVITFPLTGLSTLSLASVFWVSLLSAPLAPLFALLLATIAQNKVQGFAVMKGIGSFMLIPLAAFFIPAWWQILFGIFPTYWPLKLYWLLDAGDSTAWVYFVVGLIFEIGLLAL
ncbi:MAG: ABC transporter permease, partial [Methylococcales bacterium]|nr:ABC transporter permease [Methylococcales bacterium]